MTRISKSTGGSASGLLRNLRNMSRFYWLCFPYVRESTHRSVRIALRKWRMSCAESSSGTTGQPSISASFLLSTGFGQANISLKTDDLSATDIFMTRKMLSSARRTRSPSSSHRSGSLWGSIWARQDLICAITRIPSFQTHLPPPSSMKLIWVRLLSLPIQKLSQFVS